MKVELCDSDLNKYALRNDGCIILTLAKKPKSGSSVRNLGRRVIGGLFVIDRSRNWHREAKCWYIARFLLTHAEKFGIGIIRLEGQSDERIYRGYVHPQVLLDRDSMVHYRGYEAQTMIRPEDLKPTAEDAAAAFRELLNERRKRSMMTAPRDGLKTGLLF